MASTSLQVSSGVQSNVIEPGVIVAATPLTITFVTISELDLDVLLLAY